MGVVGRAAEATGNSGALAKMQRLAPIELVTGHPVAAAVSAVGPEVLKGGGRLLQRGGAALDGLDLSLKGRVPAAAGAAAAAEDAESPFAGRRPYVPQGTEIRDYGAELSPHEAPAYVRQNAPSGDIRGSAAMQGLRDAVAKAAPENAWANDASAQPVSDVESTVEDAQRNHRVYRGLVEPNAFTGNSLSGLEEAASNPRVPQNYLDNEVAGIGQRAQAMGDQTVKGLRDQGYTVPEGGFRSTQDIDRFLQTPQRVPDLAADAGVDEGDAQAIRNLFDNYFGSKLAAAGKR
jgi:hypothetical protein